MPHTTGAGALLLLLLLMLLVVAAKVQWSTWARSEGVGSIGRTYYCRMSTVHRLCVYTHLRGFSLSPPSPLPNMLCTERVYTPPSTFSHCTQIGCLHVRGLPAFASRGWIAIEMHGDVTRQCCSTRWWPPEYHPPLYTPHPCFSDILPLPPLSLPSLLCCRTHARVWSNQRQTRRSVIIASPSFTKKTVNKK